MTGTNKDQHVPSLEKQLDDILCRRRPGRHGCNSSQTRFPSHLNNNADIITHPSSWLQHFFPCSRPGYPKLGLSLLSQALRQRQIRRCQWANSHPKRLRREARTRTEMELQMVHMRRSGMKQLTVLLKKQCRATPILMDRQPEASHRLMILLNLPGGVVVAGLLPRAPSPNLIPSRKICRYYPFPQHRPPRHPPHLTLDRNAPAP